MKRMTKTCLPIPLMEHQKRRRKPKRRKVLDGLDGSVGLYINLLRLSRRRIPRRFNISPRHNHQKYRSSLNPPNSCKNHRYQNHWYRSQYQKRQHKQYLQLLLGVRGLGSGMGVVQLPRRLYPHKKRLLRQQNQKQRQRHRKKRPRHPQMLTCKMHLR